MSLDIREIETRLMSLTDYVRDCERRVLRGEFMDLKGLDRNVTEVCAALTALPRTEARTLETRMSGMLDGLDALARAMKDQQGKIRARA